MRLERDDHSKLLPRFLSFCSGTRRHGYKAGISQSAQKSRHRNVH